MVSFSKSEGSDWELPDPGFYVLRYVGIASSYTHPIDTTKAGYDPTHPPKPETSHQFRFVIDDPDNVWDGVEVRSWYPERFTDKNKTGVLFSAIFGGEGVPDDLDETMLFDKKFQATIKHEVSKKNGNTYPSVESPIAYRPRGAGGPRRRMAVSEPDDGDEPGF